MSGLQTVKIYKCNKQLATGKRISMNGIKYECVTAEDIATCLQIVKENKQNAFMSDQQRLSKLNNIHKCTKCDVYSKPCHWDMNVLIVMKMNINVCFIWEITIVIV